MFFDRQITIDTVEKELESVNEDDIHDGVLQVQHVRLLMCIADALNQVSSTLETISNSLEYLSENARKEIDL